MRTNSDYSEVDARIQVRSQILGCTNCDLRDRATRPVPFTGSNPNYLVVIGEAPGASEDKEGEPFVGPAGSLLRRAIDVAFGDQGVSDYLTYINAVSCYPAERRTPTQRQIKACLPNLWAQLEAIRPRYGLVCGGSALSAMVPAIRGGRRPDGSLAAPQTITALRGKWVQVDASWDRLLLLVVWHPAVVLSEGGINTPKGRELTSDLAMFANVVYKHPEIAPAILRTAPSVQLHLG